MAIPFDIQDQVSHYTQFHPSKKWKNIEAWTGVFNPIIGTLKGARYYAGIALTVYEAISLWGLVILINVFDLVLGHSLDMGHLAFTVSHVLK